MRTRFGERSECDGCDRDAKFYRVKARRSYACEHCGFQVYPTAGTPFERTRTPLRDWFFVMFQFCTSRNGVAAKEVERQLGVTYKTAWRMCHQIREYMGAVDGNDPIGGIGTAVEVDETFIGGVKRGKNMRGAAGKIVVLGMLERGGDVITCVVPNHRAATLLPVIQSNVLPGGQLHSDELRSYTGMHTRGYRHMTVNHSAREYVGFQGASTNALEGYWASLKRGINGTHIHVSAKHLPKYLGEFEYRHNMRHAPHLMLDRLMVSFAR
jgi:transposase